MKAEKKVIPYIGFKPFEIVLTVENEEEAKALYAMFNYVHNSKLFSDPEILEYVKDAIGREFYTGTGEVIANGLNYKDYYVTLKRVN